MCKQSYCYHVNSCMQCEGRTEHWKRQVLSGRKRQDEGVWAWSTGHVDPWAPFGIFIGDPLRRAGGVAFGQVIQGMDVLRKVSDNDTIKNCGQLQ